MSRTSGFLGALAMMLAGSAVLPPGMEIEPPEMEIEPPRTARRKRREIRITSRRHEVLSHGKQEFFIMGVRIISYSAQAADKKFNKLLKAGKIRAVGNGHFELV